MGAAAFQNEVINQLSEAYLLHQQRQLREKGVHNWRIAPDHYRDELQKVKAYITTHNVYGVDLNPTAIELGKLSLWLNVIHKDMETPFFANRLTVGNAVIGAWLKVYSKNQFYGISDRYGSKLKPNKWWECAPHKVKFFKNSVNRSVNEVYHFLLPDANMLGVRSIKEQKELHPNEDRRMGTILKDWIAPIGAYEFQILQRISAKIDILLKEHFIDQLTIEKYTNNRKEVWDGIDHSAQESLFKIEEQVESYAQKQRLYDTRYGHNNAYRKLKLVMDYWCALWFWSYDDTLSLPTREEYWKDIEALLAVDNERLDRRTRLALERTGKGMLAEDDTEFNRITDEEAQIVARTQEELLTEARGSRSLFADDDPMRFKIVARLSERYHFFHPMLDTDSTVIENFLGISLDDDYSPKEMITALELIMPKLEELYNTRVRHYVVKKHTLLVCEQFEKYAFAFDNKCMNMDLMRLVLAIHDIGKAIDRSTQHEHTLSLVRELWENTPFTEHEFNLVEVLLRDDHLGSYFQNKYELSDLKEEIVANATELKMSPSILLQYKMILYQCDIASYTKDAGGLKYLEHMFVYENGEKAFDEENGIIAMSEEYADRYVNLKESINE